MDVLRRNDGNFENASEDPRIKFFVYAGDTPPAVRHLRRFVLEAHNEIPMHEHTGPDNEVLIPLRGLFRVICNDGQEADVGVGDIIVSNHDQAYAVTNLTSEPAELLIFSTPPGDNLNA